MASTTRTPTPVHLWFVGGVALAWNAIGAFDYTMTHLRGAAFMREMGIDEATVAYMEAVPDWATAAWALGVWGGLAGAILLLLRSRFAGWAFAVSLLGTLVMAVNTYGKPLPPSFASPGAIAFDWTIKLVAALLLWYAWAMRRRGALR